MILLPEDCMITAANILPILSLVLILFFPTTKFSRFAFILHVQLTYQLATNLTLISSAVFELGRSIISSSVCGLHGVVIEYVFDCNHIFNIVDIVVHPLLLEVNLTLNRSPFLPVEEDQTLDQFL
jgi:hypothetical protein